MEVEKKAPKLVVEEVAETGQTPTVPEPVPQTVPEKAPDKFNILWILVPGILILGLLMGGIYAYLRGLNKLNNPTPSPTPIATLASPTPTPADKQTDLTKYLITILNGSGIAGEAAKVKDILEEAGFKVGSTANAKTYDYAKTEISTKTTVEADFVKSLATALGKTYQIADPATSSAQTSPVIVTVGNLKAK